MNIKIIFGAVLGVLLLYGGYADAKTPPTATVSLLFDSWNTMLPPQEREPRQKPEPKIYTVKAGDNIENFLKVVKVGDDYVKFASDIEYYASRSSKIVKRFTVKKGETCRLQEANLCDEVSILEIEIIDLSPPK